MKPAMPKELGDTISSIKLVSTANGEKLSADVISDQFVEDKITTQSPEKLEALVEKEISFNEIAKILVQQVESLLEKLGKNNLKQPDELLREIIVDTLEALGSCVKKKLYEKEIFLQLPFKELKDKLVKISETNLRERLISWCTGASQLVESFMQSPLYASYGNVPSLIYLLRTNLLEQVSDDYVETLLKSEISYTQERAMMISAVGALECARIYSPNDKVFLEAHHKIDQLEARFLYGFTHQAVYDQFDQLPAKREAYLSLFKRVKSIGLHLIEQGEFATARCFLRTLRLKQIQFSYIDNELLQLMERMNSLLLKEKTVPSSTGSDACRYRKLLNEIRDLAPQRWVDKAIFRVQQNTFSESYERFFQMLFQESEYLIGSPPRSFVIFALGSTSEGMRTVYSDFEYTIAVVGEEILSLNEQAYIERFNQLFEFKMLSIAEPKGLRLEIFDGNVAQGGCWGRVSDLIKVIKLAKDPANAMARSLLHPKCIYVAKAPGDDDIIIGTLIKKYYEAIAELESTVEEEQLLTRKEQRILKQLTSHMSRLVTAASKVGSKNGNLDIKIDIYQPLFFILQDLCYLYEIESSNYWDRLAQLIALSPIFIEELQQSFADLLVFRNQLQMHYQQQKEILQFSDNRDISSSNIESVKSISREEEIHLSLIVKNVIQPLCQWLQSLFYVNKTLRSSMDTMTRLRGACFDDPAELLRLKKDLDKYLATEEGSSLMKFSYKDENERGTTTKSAFVKVELTENILNKKREFKKITREMLQRENQLNEVFHWKHFESRRAVWPILNSELKPTFYIKALPEFPGLEIAYGLLARLLFGPLSPVTLLTKWTFVHPNAEPINHCYPVLASRAVQGINFSLILADPILFSLFMKTWKQTNREQLFILTLLTNPDDGRASNFIAEIIESESGYLSLNKGVYTYTPEKGRYCFTGHLHSVDNDRIFFPAVTQEMNPKVRELHPVVRVNTILFLFDEIAKEPISSETMERLLAIHPIELIESWLMLIEENKDSFTLFSTEEILHLSKAPLPEKTSKSIFNFFSGIKDKPLETDYNTSFLAISLPLQTTIWSVYKKIQKMQTLFKCWHQQKCQGTLLDVLKEVEPLIGKAYERELHEKKPLQSRFSAFEGLNSSMTSTVSKTPMTSRTMNTTLISIGELINDNGQGPQQALESFRSALKKYDFNTLAGIFVQSLYESLYESKEQTRTRAVIKDFLARLDQHQQKILSAINFLALDSKKYTAEHIQSIQKIIADQIFGVRQHHYTYLKLHHWQYLTNSNIIKLLKNAPHLTYLDLTGCAKLSESVIEIAAKHCLLLKHLCMSKTAIRNIQINLGNISSLEKLEVKDCWQLKQINIEVSRLKSLSADNCQNLSSMRVDTNHHDAKATLTQCSLLQDRDLRCHLDLTTCQLEKFPEHFKQVLNAILKGTITEVKLSTQNLNDEHIKALAITLRNNSSVQILDLYDNKIGSKGCSFLAQVLTTSINNIQQLDLSHNNLFDDSLGILAEALKTNKSLKVIKLSLNSFKNEGIKMLAEALKKNSSVMRIELNCNESLLTDISGALILEGLLENRMLEQLSLQETYNGRRLGDINKRLESNRLKKSQGIEKRKVVKEEQENFLQSNKLCSEI